MPLSLFDCIKSSPKVRIFFKKEEILFQKLSIWGGFGFSCRKITTELMLCCAFFEYREQKNYSPFIFTSSILLFFETIKK
jgi:hypothetical protein